MPIDPAAAGAATGPFESSWSADDCMRYALSVGAAMDDPLGDDLAFVTENTRDRPLVALPTMCMVLGGVLHAPSPMRNIGTYDPKMSVHGSVEFTLHRPLPTSASVRSTITVDSITDKRSGALVELSIDAEDVEGAPLFQVRNGIFIRGEGGFGGLGGTPWPSTDTGERDADVVVTQRTRRDQPLHYRLNGDHNPLHSDPAVAIAAGFARPIMHGVCTVGFVGRAIVHAVCEGDPTRIHRFGCRFASPAMPGDPLETRIWRTEEGAMFTTMAGDRTVLGSGFVFLRP